MVYILFLDTTDYDFETHYYSQVVGVYSTKEKAAEAKKRFYEQHTRDDIRADEWELSVETYTTDTDKYFPKGD